MGGTSGLDLNPPEVMACQVAAVIDAADGLPQLAALDRATLPRGRATPLPVNALQGLEVALASVALGGGGAGGVQAGKLGE